MDEIDRMLNYLRLDTHPLAGAFREIAVCRAVPKQEVVVSPNIDQPYIFFLVAGLLRGYLEDERGFDITDCFSYRYGDSRMSFLRSERGRVDEYVETLEDTLLITFELDKIMPYFLQEPALMNICFERMADIYSEQVLHKRMLCHTTALERYRWFLKNYPSIIDRAPHRHVASFLNITPETLSRLRREERNSREAGKG